MKSCGEWDKWGKKDKLWWDEKVNVRERETKEVRRRWNFYIFPCHSMRITTAIPVCNDSSGFLQ